MNTIRKNKRFLMLCGLAILILTIPFIAMQFSSEVNWSLSDFLIMGGLLFGTVLLIELILRTIKTRRNRIIFCLVVLLLFFLVWAELAVGIFNSPWAGS